MVKLAFSPDAKTLATISTERATLWNAATGRKRRQVSWEAQPVHVSFSPDGSKVAVADGDWTVTIWDSNMRTVLRTLDIGVIPAFRGGPVELWAVTWCPDSSTIAVVQVVPETSVYSWYADTGEHLTGDRGYFYARRLACSPDGRLLAFEGQRNGAWGIWDVVSNQQVAVLPPSNDRAVSAVAWLAGGERLALGAADGTVVVWDLGTNAAAYELIGHTTWPMMMVAPAGTTTLISVSKDELIVWDLDAREALHWVSVPDLKW